jgi:hypothetical protein
MPALVLLVGKFGGGGGGGETGVLKAKAREKSNSHGPGKKKIGWWCE